ncbi:MAG: class I SAM-dependent methyltransferase [Sulfolobales archaeon]|nr:class I SAM-dependent methyltransferase [Sulfolobales archaeon]
MVTASGREVYDELMSIYDSIAFGYSSFRVRAWDVVNELTNCVDLVVDVGCGPCHNGLAVAQRSGSKLLCVDISQEMLSVAKKAVSKFRDDSLVIRSEFVQADMRYLPIRSEVVGCITYIASINHVLPDDLGRVLMECFRVLRSGGKGLITAWAATHPTVLKGLVRNLIDVLLLRRRLGGLFDIRVPWRSRGKTFFRYYHIYRPSEVVKCLVSVGLKVVKVGVYNPHRRLLAENYYVLLIK